ncbi:hypothetical protein TorRG33x02_129900 [Trema orientale]|uniref:Uncharacterized protein n=1 Tax=Trema orientale TaxID=63057 RepID=A0A2P5F051_TREOI|nr:hypothetical protein TorRG33x02_129900 [Trema orientale]
MLSGQIRKTSNQISTSDRQRHELAPTTSLAESLFSSKQASRNDRNGNKGGKPEDRGGKPEDRGGKPEDRGVHGRSGWSKSPIQKPIRMCSLTGLPIRAV